MHKLSRLKPKWAPTIIETAPGVFSSDPRKLLANQANASGSHWKATPCPEPLEVLDRDCFESLMPEDIRATRKKFSPHTAQSLGGAHVRHYGMLRDEGLGALCCIFQAVENIGVFPKHRKGDFDERHPGKYWAFDSGKSAESSILNQAVKAEAEEGDEGVTGAFSRDGSKYYESFRPTTLRDRSLEAGLPGAVVKVTFNIWRGPRIRRLGTDHSLAPLRATGGRPS
eukprot:8341621-Pyramimonas_sp.AAC.1